MSDETVIAIDGPAGAGKTTAARGLAAELGLDYIDTGATFRAVALKALRQGIDLDDGPGLAQLARRSEIHLGGGTRPKVLLDGEDVSEAIRGPSISMASSRAAVHAELRAVLVELWRHLARGRAVVLEGRDIGTEVFPNADLKFFLDAGQDERARRRFRERGSEGGITFEGVRNDLALRDRADRNREHAPLRRAEDAIVIDTTSLGSRETLEKLLAVARNRLGLP